MRKTVTYLILWLVTLSGAASVAQDLPPSTLYSPDLQHPWNQLNSALFARVAPEGTVYGLQELDILYWQSTEHLLIEPSHTAALRLMDRFIQAHQERLIRDPLKRALLQRDLWELFDWAAMRDGRSIVRQTTNVAQRAELEERLAKMIRALALNEAEITALPDNYAASAPDPDLPRGLFAPDAGWITVRSRDSGGLPVASLHTAAFNGHSVFLVMVRLPKGREQTVEYLNSLRDFEGPLVYASQDQTHRHTLQLNPAVPQFPAGTQWALVRRMCVIDSQGHIRPTGFVESVQLRRYDSVDPDDSQHAQQMIEFDMDKRRAGSLRRIAPGEVDFQFVHFHGMGGDPFELPFKGQAANPPNPSAIRHPTVGTCYQCHSFTGILSVASFNRMPFGQLVQRLEASPEAVAPSYTPPPNAQEEADSTVLWKYGEFDWGLLEGLWRKRP